MNEEEKLIFFLLKLRTYFRKKVFKKELNWPKRWVKKEMLYIRIALQLLRHKS